MMAVFTVFGFEVIYMKKLLAICVSLFFCMFAGLSYTQADNKAYNEDSYYKIDVEEPPDYRTLYDKTYVAQSNTSSCKTTNFSNSGKLIRYGTVDTGIPGYWFINNRSIGIDDAQLLNKKIVLDTEGQYIICPFDAELISESATNDGHSMVIKVNANGEEYRLTFSNMDRWYCCMGRTNPEKDYDGNTTWTHTCEELKGHTFKGGNVLGLTTKDTTVEIARYNGKSTDAANFYEMYMN